MRYEGFKFRFSLISFVVALFFAVYGGPFASVTAAGETKKDYKGLVIHLATQPSQVQISLAEELGYFKDEFGGDGITFDVRTFPSGPPIIEAIAAGNIDIGQVGNLPAIQAFNNKIPIKIIGAYMTDTGKSQGLLSRKGSGIEKLEDIRGRKIGAQIGSASHFLLMQYLQTLNLTEDDIQIVNLSFGDINAALEAGSIDGGVNQLPQMASVLENGTATLIADASGYPLSPSTVVARTALLEKYPELIPRILKTFDRAVQYCITNEDDAIRILHERNDVAESAYKASFTSNSFALFLDAKRIEALKLNEVFLRKEGTITGVDIDKLVDASFLEAAGLNTPK
ncbi:MAG: ABC transporter substrate-binding protein [Synergistaceae bacterium]|jgi:sulfonate transport system substrate-binding protein|nr:ABC transporter substrate-binding protein [Synergistaceae bacterium]